MQLHICHISHLLDYEFSGTWDEFFKHLQAGKLLYGDQYEWYKDFVDHNDLSQILFIKYEDMKEDLLREIKRLIAFLGLNVSHRQIQYVIRDSHIEAMKPNFRDVPKFKPNTYVRNGQSGEWKKYFTVAQNEWFDSKYKKLYESLPFDVHYE